MSKKLSPEEKQAKADAKAADAQRKADAKASGEKVSDDLTQVAGVPHVVTFDHSFDDSEPVMRPDSAGKMLYTGHDKQIKTTVKGEITYPNIQLAEMFKANHEKYPEHGVSNIKIKKA